MLPVRAGERRGRLSTRLRVALAIAVLAATGPALLTLSGCGQEDPAGPAPGSGIGSIGIRSSARGAAIQLDGVATGAVTPDTLTGVSEGAHTVSVALAGFAVTPESASVTVSNGATTSVYFTMSALVPLGSIGVTSDIPGGDILLDGVATGRTAPDTMTTVPVGNHVVGIRHVGATVAPASIPVTVTDGGLVMAAFDEELIVGGHRIVLLEHFTNW